MSPRRFKLSLGCSTWGVATTVGSSICGLSSGGCTDIGSGAVCTGAGVATTGLDGIAALEGGKGEVRGAGPVGIIGPDIGVLAG